MEQHQSGKRIIAGLIIGIILGMVVPQFSVIGLLGQLLLVH